MGAAAAAESHLSPCLSPCAHCSGGKERGKLRCSLAAAHGACNPVASHRSCLTYKNNRSHKGQDLYKGPKMA